MAHYGVEPSPPIWRVHRRIIACWYRRLFGDKIHQMCCIDSHYTLTTVPRNIECILLRGEQFWTNLGGTKPMKAKSLSTSIYIRNPSDLTYGGASLGVPLVKTMPLSVRFWFPVCSVRVRWILTWCIDSNSRWLQDVWLGSCVQVHCLIGRSTGYTSRYEDDRLVCSRLFGISWTSGGAP